MGLFSGFCPDEGPPELVSEAHGGLDEAHGFGDRALVGFAFVTVHGFAPVFETYDCLVQVRCEVLVGDNDVAGWYLVDRSLSDVFWKVPCVWARLSKGAIHPVLGMDGLVGVHIITVLTMTW